MPKHRSVAAISALSAAACVALISACSSPQHASTVPGTTPAVWTGSPAPSAPAGTEGDQQQPAAQSITTQLKAPDGTRVATAKFDFSNGYATITIATTGAAGLAPGFHGVHIHKTGKCEPNSTAAPGGAPADTSSRPGIPASPPAAI
jgi:superoxide dismutase, Cu-Zn family